VSWSIFQWWDLRSTPALRARMQVDEARFQERTTELSDRYPHLGIWSQSVDTRARTHFFISANGEVYTFAPRNLEPECRHPRQNALLHLGERRGLYIRFRSSFDDHHRRRTDGSDR
jgi:hypothetical protein